MLFALVPVGGWGAAKLHAVRCRECRKARFSYNAAVIAVQFSPDGTCIASGGGYRTAKVWDGTWRVTSACNDVWDVAAKRNTRFPFRQRRLDDLQVIPAEPNVCVRSAQHFVLHRIILSRGHARQKK